MLTLEFSAAEKELEDIDAIVISGSFEDDAHEDATWILRLAGERAIVSSRALRRVRVGVS